jgi:glycerol-3-phosphate dehydrogenase (NAD(P)+)
MRIGVLGTGAFGTAWARLLAGRGHDVVWWARRREVADEIAATRTSPHLPGVDIPASIEMTSDLGRAVDGMPFVLSVTPSHAIRQVLGEAAPRLGADTVVVNASKGIEEGTLATVDEIYRQVLPAPIAARAAFLSGPTFARELAQGLPAAIVVASHDAEAASGVQAQFSTDRLRVYTTDDVTGVELGGALKNVVAIGAGIADGLGFGHNTRAMLITRGLSEIARLGAKLGAHPMTFAGLAGMGDLVLTCTGDLSRNRQLGLELGRGRALADILGGTTSVVEGVKTTRAAHALAAKVGVDMPLTAAIHAILYEGKSPRQAVSELMTRDLKHERA